MHKPVVITSESTCDLPPQLLERYAVQTIPMYVVLGEQALRDGVEITPDGIYSYYDKTGQLPKTAAIPPEEYRCFFEKFVQAGFSVVHVALSSGISSTGQNALLAAEELPEVYVVNSMSLSVGVGLQVLRACRLRDGGKNAKEIYQALCKERAQVAVSFVLDKLEYLAKGGRCSMVTALGANLLGIKPVIEMSSGTLLVGRKLRGRFADCCSKYLLDKLPHANPDAPLFVVHAGLDPALVDSLLDQARANTGCKEIYLARAGCTISAHCGPGTFSVMYLKR